MTTISDPTRSVAASVLSPLVVSLPNSADATQALDLAWCTACDSVPISKYTFEIIVKEKRKKVPYQRTIKRSVERGTGNDLWLHTARLCDALHGEKSDWSRWRWKVAGRIAAPHDTSDATLRAPAVVIISTTGFRAKGGAVVDAGPLAYFRHLVVAGLRALDPELTVTGGQHDWDDAWWPIADSHKVYE